MKNTPITVTRNRSKNEHFFSIVDGVCRDESDLLGTDTIAVDVETLLFCYIQECFVDSVAEARIVNKENPNATIFLRLF